MKGQKAESGSFQRHSLPTDDSPELDSDWLLAPIGIDEFVAKYWDQLPLHIKGRGADYYSDLYTLPDFDTALNTNGIRSPFLRLVRDGSDIPLESLSSGGFSRANLLEDVIRKHQEGATIVLQFLHEQNKLLKDLSRDLSAVLSTYVQVNAYLTPMGERGLDIHYDTHDVFVIQIHGTKNWTLYDRTPLIPFKNERGPRSEMDDAKPTQSLTLSPGDCLYVPRGWIHKAESLESSSLHLTVGVHPLRWGELILGAVTGLIRNDPRFRHALPPGFATSELQRGVAQNHMHELWSVLTQGINAGDILDEAVLAARLDTPSRLDGHLLDIHKLDQIDQNTFLKIRNNVRLSIENDDSTVRVTYHGKVLECPAALTESLQFVAERKAFTVSELPSMLTAMDKLVLARRLVEEGLLTFTDPKV